MPRRCGFAIRHLTWGPEAETIRVTTTVGSAVPTQVNGSSVQARALAPDVELVR